MLTNFEPFIVIEVFKILDFYNKCVHNTYDRNIKHRMELRSESFINLKIIIQYRLVHPTPLP